MATKALYILPHLPFTHTDSHARCHSARQEQLGLGILFMDTQQLLHYVSELNTQISKILQR